MKRWRMARRRRSQRPLKFFAICELSNGPQIVKSALDRLPSGQNENRTVSFFVPTIPLRRKLAILADAAKYDASCASSGGAKRDSRTGRGVGSTSSGMGVCHAYTPDGRCVSLLKVLLTNFCTFDCAYCINRNSSNVERARFSVDEVVQLTLNFYKRNYIEGLFLSSGVIRSADYTQGELTRVAKTLREVHDFRGYIHLKLIAGASPELAAEAGLYADRLSVNIELPQEASLKTLAPEKTALNIRQSMGQVAFEIDRSKDRTLRKTRAPRYAPAGQSTQMIVGADASTDADVLERSEQLYGGFRLRRVYYSAFSPIPDSSHLLPSKRPHLMREHRLYEADWLLRFYGFSHEEIVSTAQEGMLDADIDPKLAWALKNRGRFPLDINTAEREELLRVPGLGVKSVDRLLATRRYKTLRYEDLTRLGGAAKRFKPFVVTPDWRPSSVLDRSDLDGDMRAASSRAAPRQLELF